MADYKSLKNENQLMPINLDALKEDSINKICLHTALDKTDIIRKRFLWDGVNLKVQLKFYKFHKNSPQMFEYTHYYPKAEIENASFSFSCVVSRDFTDDFNAMFL